MLERRGEERSKDEFGFVVRQAGRQEMFEGAGWNGRRLFVVTVVNWASTFFFL